MLPTPGYKGIRLSLVFEKHNVFNNSWNSRHELLEPRKDRFLFHGYVMRVELFQFHNHVVLRALPVLMVLIPGNAVQDIVETRECVGRHIDLHNHGQFDFRLLHVDTFCLNYHDPAARENPKVWAAG